MKIWRERATNTDIITHVCINDFFTDEEKAIVKKAVGDNGVVLEMHQTRFGVCQKAYELSSKLQADSDDDIVIFASDDFYPPNDWDTYLINKLRGKQGGLMVRDGYQLPDSSNMLYPCITIPIMTYGCLKQLNKVIYHPAYYHMFSDSELYMNLKDLDLLIDDRLTDTTVFEHHHYVSGKRNPDQNDVNYNLKWMDDDKMWKIRLQMNVKERLAV